MGNAGGRRWKGGRGESGQDLATKPRVEGPLRRDSRGVGAGALARGGAGRGRSFFEQMKWQHARRARPVLRRVRLVRGERRDVSS